MQGGEIRVERDERFPFYDIDCTWRGDVVDVPADTAARWRRVTEEFEAVQGEIHVAWMEQTEEGRRHAIWLAERIARHDAQTTRQHTK